MIAASSVAVLLKPNADDELVDILFVATWPELADAFRGGLDGTTVLAVSDNPAELRRHAVELLDIRDTVLRNDGTDAELDAAVRGYMTTAATQRADNEGRR